jgi:nitroreductase
MDFDRVIEERHSCRAFREKIVDWRKVVHAIEAGTKSPFAGNEQGFRFVIIENKEKIAKIAKFANQSWIAEAPILIVVGNDELKLEKLYGERGRVYSRQQAGAAIQNILLHLTNEGLGCCWVGAYTDELIKHLLGMPSHVQIEAIIPVGYERHEKSKKRYRHQKDLEHFMFWEAWETRRRPTIYKEPIDPTAIG